MSKVSTHLWNSFEEVKELISCRYDDGHQSSIRPSSKLHSLIKSFNAFVPQNLDLPFLFLPGEVQSNIRFDHLLSSILIRSPNHLNPLLPIRCITIYIASILALISSFLIPCFFLFFYSTKKLKKTLFDDKDHKAENV